MELTNYDYIFLGAGCASLSIITRMIDSNKFNQKKILLVDKQAKIKNDRTWCFWEEEPGYFEKIVYHKWKQLFFNTGNEIVPLKMDNYQYKMIRGIDFYDYCFSKIKFAQNIDIIYGDISFEEGDDELLQLTINNERIVTGKNTIVFSSIQANSKKQKGKFYLLQHFKGWLIETSDDVFNPSQATIMDFSVLQTHGTTFVYVLPLSTNKALIEYTVFSENLLAEEDYNKELYSYLDKISGLKNYTIVEEEFGVIPMTNAHFPAFKGGVYFIGTAGGQTKPSTGYTFRFIQKEADSIVDELISKEQISTIKKINRRFLFYDSTLLHILSKRLLAGKTIFSTLFKKNPATIIFKFLDNETTIAQELKLLNSLPKRIFSKAGFTELVKMIRKREHD
jgi:lycopene beta-cyclase